jgi:hypothetical protein
VLHESEHRFLGYSLLEAFPSSLRVRSLYLSSQRHISISTRRSLLCSGTKRDRRKRTGSKKTPETGAFYRHLGSQRRSRRLVRRDFTQVDNHMLPCKERDNGKLFVATLGPPLRGILVFQPKHTEKKHSGRGLIKSASCQASEYFPRGRWPAGQRISLAASCLICNENVKPSVTHLRIKECQLLLRSSSARALVFYFLRASFFRVAGSSFLRIPRKPKTEQQPYAS